MITPQQHATMLADIQSITDRGQMEMKLRFIAKTAASTIKGSPLSLVGADITPEDVAELATDLAVFEHWLREGGARLGGMP